MDRPGEQGLAGAGLAAEEHRRVRLGGEGDPLVDGVHGGPASDDEIERTLKHHPGRLVGGGRQRRQRERAPELEIDGEMHGDAALDPVYRRTLMPRTLLSGEANLLVMPNIDAANISYNLLKTAAGNGIAIGPVLLGAARPVHVLTASATVRRLVNMTAWTIVDINAQR